jgi:hypothetical protein
MRNRIVFLLMLSCCFLGFQGCEKNSGSATLTHCDNLMNDPILPADNVIVSFPNAFSPNGDGVNDIYLAQVSGFQSIVFTVTDDNNNVLYSSTQLAAGVRWSVSSITSSQLCHYRFEGITNTNKKVGKCGDISVLFCLPKGASASSFVFLNPGDPVLNVNCP